METMMIIAGVLEDLKNFDVWTKVSSGVTWKELVSYVRLYFTKIK
jgi:hypothetical protein